MTYAGKTSEEKRQAVAKAVADAGADAALVTSPTSIAWLFNIRGADVSRSPLPLGRAIVHKDGKAMLFIAPEKTGNDLPAHLGDDVDLRAEIMSLQRLKSLAPTARKSQSIRLCRQRSM